MFRFVVSMILLNSLTVFAQTAPTTEVSSAATAVPAAGPTPVETQTNVETLPSAPVKKEGIERIEVTGSHIKRIDAEGASPVKTVTRVELEKSGYNSVSDVLRDQTANSFGSLREQSGSNAAGVAHVDLRGLGASNTLVLLNGQRLPTDAVTGAVDLNLIENQTPRWGCRGNNRSVSYDTGGVIRPLGRA